MNEYFHEIFKKYGTEFWSNNPSGRDMKVALELGAVGVATNPGYFYNLLNSDKDYAYSIIDRLLKQYDTNDKLFPMKLHEEALKRPLNLFLPIYKNSNGRYGYVAIQGDPRYNDNLELILEEAERFHELGENVIIKVPSTIEGAKAMEELTARGWPTIGTMGFSVAQYVYMAEAYNRGLQRTSKKPRCLITVIPGIFDEYVTDYIAENNLKVSNKVIKFAGISVVRAAYKIYCKRNYKTIVLVGAMRKPYHWIELVGNDIGMTVGGSLADEIIQENALIESRINNSTPEEILEKLREKLPDFVKAYDEDALKPQEFHLYGPFKRFQDASLNYYAKVIEIISNLKRN